MRSGMGVREVAEFLNLGENTVRRWADSGRLICTKTRGGHRRFDPEYIQRFADVYLPSLDLDNVEPDPEPPDGLEL